MISSIAFSQEYREESTLNYTYIGPAISFSYNSAEYSEWKDDTYNTETTSGMTYAGGLDIVILTSLMCGDFQAKYSYSQYDTTLTCLEFIISGKYLYSINNRFSAGGGLGLYCETPPSSSEHNGSAGILIPLTGIYNTTSDTRLIIDIYMKYGSFAMGDNTSLMSFGCNIGFVYKVGRI